MASGGAAGGAGGPAGSLFAPLSSPTPFLDTPQTAAYTGKLAVIERLDEASLLKIDSDGRSLLHWASASSAGLPVVSYLLQKPAIIISQLNAADEEKWTPLMSATAAGALETVKLLLSKGADANARNENMQIPLHYNKGRAHIVEALLPHTKDINAKDKAGQTPLHRAAGPGHLAVLGALLHAGAAIDAQDKLGNTALHYACEEGSVEAAKLLLEHGARRDIKNSAGKTAEDMSSGDGKVKAGLAKAAGAGL